MLKQPDLSRGHDTLSGLFLANPGLVMTADEAGEVLVSMGYPARTRLSLATTLAGYGRTGKMRRDERGAYRLMVPPEEVLSPRERGNKNARAYQARQRGRTTPRPEKTEGASRAEKIHAARQAHVGELAAQLVAHIKANPDRLHDEQSLKRAISASPSLIRQAITDILADPDLGIRYWNKGRGICSAGSLLSALPAPRPNLQLTPTHRQLLAALNRRRSMSMVEVRDVLQLKATDKRTAQEVRAQSEQLALDLHHLQLATLKVIGASYILRSA